jgi:hypothetical protein
MDYTIKSIETRYAGVTFRSRLEAKWAAVFDMLHWKWTYEPDDFDGWIPDFAIHGKTLVYVEVKPVYSFPKDVADKIDESGCPDEVMIVGSRGPKHDGWNSTIGWLREVYEEQTSWDDAMLGRWGRPPVNQIGFCHASGRFVDRITGLYDGGSYGSGDATGDMVDFLWREAGNRTRWNPRQ